MQELPSSVDGRGPAATAVEFARKRKGLKQLPLSRAAGLSKGYVNKLEDGTIQPSLRAFAHLARTLQLSPLEVWTIVMAEASASPLCPRCGGKAEVNLPRGDDIIPLPCPVCVPWPDGFPGEKACGQWVIPPYGPGETPEYRPMAKSA